MARWLAAFVLMCLSGCAAFSQRLPRESVASYAEYSNTSSHIFLGSAQNRRQAGAGLVYGLVLHRGRRFLWSYEAELRPLTFLQDPVSTKQLAIQFNGYPVYGPFVVQDGPIQSRCHSFAAVTVQPNYIETEKLTCGTRWTCLGGVQPLGQRFDFAPRRRVHPSLLVNVGYVVSNNSIPVNNATQFNFTFDVGAGVALGTQWGADYRYRHISNAYSGDVNPGIDSQVMRLTYVLRRFDRDSVQ